MTTTIARESQIAHIPGIRQPEATALAESQNKALLHTLYSLDDAQWDAPTDCEGWSVKDIASHIYGWAQSLTSLKETRRQVGEALRRRKELGNILDAQNQVQADAGRAMSNADLLLRMEEALPRMVRRRASWGRYGRYTPIYGPPFGLSNLGYLCNVIFTRDVFMHRIDVTRATGTELELGPDESRIVADIVREWGRGGSGDVRLELTGRAGGTFVAGSSPHTKLTGDAVEFCRFLAGRADASVIEATGDQSVARRRMAADVPF
ncbi:MAG TPA: maleylpyruvate isomerase family mycothiol-dependent enzyme [Actinomycetota bacterium]